MTTDVTPRPILDAHGKPARTATDDRCPGCGTPCPEGDHTTRVRSGGFGAVQDLCASCGYRFARLTV